MAQKDFALQVEDKITLHEDNANPCTSFEELYADCELNSIMQNRLETKMSNDLHLLEVEMFSVLQKTEEMVQDLENDIIEANNDSEIDQTEKDRFQEYLKTLNGTKTLFSNLIEHFTKTKAIQDKLSSVLNMGGYRSLIVCMIDTLTLIIKSLEKTEPENSLTLISKGSRAFVSSIGSKLKRRTLLFDSPSTETKKAKDDSILSSPRRSDSPRNQPNRLWLSGSLPMPSEEEKKAERKILLSPRKDSVPLPAPMHPENSAVSSSVSVDSIVRTKKKRRSRTQSPVGSPDIDRKLTEFSKAPKSNIKPIEVNPPASASPKRKKKSRRTRNLSRLRDKTGDADSNTNNRDTERKKEEEKKETIALDDTTKIEETSNGSDNIEEREITPIEEPQIMKPNNESEPQPEPILPTNTQEQAITSTPETFTNSKEVQKFYQYKKEQLRATSQSERERLQKALKVLDEEEKAGIAALEAEEKEKTKELTTVIAAKKKRDFRVFKAQTRRCEKAGHMIKNLCTKLEVCTFINEGDVFMDIQEMYKNTELDPADIYVESHFGYEIDKDLKEYSKKMKVVYCAVDSSISDNKGISASIQKQMQFSYSAMRYLIKPKEASEKYGALRKQLEVKFVRNVWDLLEDPMTSFFATQFGFAPAMERMKINLEVRIPVKAGEIFHKVDEQQRTMYRNRSLSSAAFLKEKKAFEALEEEEKAKEAKVKKNGKKTKKNEESCDNDDNDNEISAQAAHIALPALGEGDESYLIRCRFLSPYNDPIDPSLVIKTNTRSNFMAKNQAEMKKTPDTLTRIFGKNLTDVSSKIKRKIPLDASGEYSDDDIQSGSNTLIIHIHGGGWVSQSPDQHISYVSEWAKMADAPVLSIDYSLSPEAKFPISPNECYAIYKWLLYPENAARLGLSTDPLRIVVCGDSAGGNLTCAVVLKAIEEGVRLPIGLLLHYPAGILSASGSLARMIFSNDPILNYQTMKVVLDCYLGEAQTQAKDNSLISPAFASKEILKHFPPTVICVGDVDPLIDDSTFMYEQLQSVGVHTILRIYRALPHGFLNLPTQLPKAVGAIRAAGVYMKWLFCKDEDIDPPEF